MIKEYIEISDEIYEHLKHISNKLGISPKEILKEYVSNLEVVSYAIEEEANMIKSKLGLDGEELTKFAISRIISLSAGLYGFILVLDEILGVWSMGFTTSHGSGKVVDESGKIQGIFLHLDGSELSMNRSLVNCVELLLHEGGIVVGFHTFFGFEGFSQEELSTIKKVVESSLSNLRSNLINRMQTCIDSVNVEVNLEEHELGISISVVVYSNKFTCIPHVNVVNSELAKVIVESGLINNIPENGKQVINSLLNK
ncbi:MAG: hypothetical protein N3G48_05690 [Sulfolobales archaeon]|nr:hypothetical protein [Sulfolobales archaeon]